jgi:hypothetical protein
LLIKLSKGEETAIIPATTDLPTPILFVNVMRHNVCHGALMSGATRELTRPFISINRANSL